MEILAKIQHVVLDMDGTIYLGNTRFDFTPAFLSFLQEQGIGYTFLTNNNSRSRSEYLDKLRGLGIEATAQQMYLSTDATVAYLRSQHAEAKRLLVVGTEGLKTDLRDAGYAMDEENPQIVVIGFDTGLEYDSLCRACYWISQGCAFVATHPDFVCPTDLQTVLPDCGAVCALITAATGKVPEQVCGKPNGWMLQSIADRQGVEVSRIAMVGDRLYTDMQMARNVGAIGVLVLSGEATKEEAAASNLPDLVVDDLAHLQQQMAESFAAK